MHPRTILFLIFLEEGVQCHVQSIADHDSFSSPTTPTLALKLSTSLSLLPTHASALTPAKTKSTPGRCRGAPRHSEKEHVAMTKGPTSIDNVPHSHCKCKMRDPAGSSICSRKKKAAGSLPTSMRISRVDVI